jgi:hypothetical protein
MEMWILLYDAACPACSRLARLVARYSNERIELRSLRDERLRNELGLPAADVNSRWEPLLVRIGSPPPRVYRGLLFRAHLIRLVGVVGGVRVVRAVRAEAIGAPSGGVTRRAVLLRAAAATAAALGLDNLWPFLPQARAASEPELLSGPALAVARHSSVAHEAARHFGAIDWGSARVLRAKDGAAEGYAVSIGKTSVLIVVYPIGREPGLSAVVTVVRHQGRTELGWFTPAGMHIRLADDSSGGSPPGPLPDTCQILPCSPRKGPRPYIHCLNNCIFADCDRLLSCCVAENHAVCCPLLVVCVATCHAVCRAYLF